MTLKSVFAVAVIAASVSSGTIKLAAEIYAPQEHDSLRLYRSVAGATLAYSVDHDGLLPLMAGSHEDIDRIRAMSYHRVEAGWQSKKPHNDLQRIREDSQIWANSILKYLVSSSEDMPLMQHGLPLTRLQSVDYKKTNLAVKRHAVGLAYNGLLHAWSKSAIATPSKLPLFSGMVFRQNLDGLAISNPVLMCMHPGSCRFHPTSMPQRADGPEGYAWLAVGEMERWTLWVIDGGMNFAAVDGSAYWKPMVFIPKHPKAAFNVNEVPWSSLDSKSVLGAPYWLTECVQPGGLWKKNSVVYAGFFRPDSLFEWKAEECNIGH